MTSKPQQERLFLDQLPIVQHSRWRVSAEKYEEQCAGFQGFRTFEMNRGDVLECGSRRTNHIVVLIEGSGEYNIEGLNSLTTALDIFKGIFSTRMMLFVAIDDKFRFIASERVQGVSFSFDSLLVDNDEPIIALLNSKVKQTEERCEILIVDELLRSFWKGVFQLIQKGVMSPWIGRLKQKELFYYIDCFNDESHKRAFLYPALNQQNTFRSLILNNCDKMVDTDSLVKLSGMCRTNFYRRFKQEFNMPIYRWMQMRRAQAVRQSASEPGISVQMLMERHQFSSASNFIRFCRMYYGCNPNELVRRVCAGLPLAINEEEVYRKSVD